MKQRNECNESLFAILHELPSYDMDKIRCEKLRQHAHKRIDRHNRIRAMKYAQMYTQLIEPIVVFGFACIFLIQVFKVAFALVG